MAAETNESREQQPAENAANDEAAQREAYDYWGYLLKPDKCGTPKLDRLLKGIAEVISKKFEPSDSPDLTPSQIAAWYRAVGGNYDVLFTETPPSSIAFIYRSLGAFHSLQPSASDDGYSSPAIPALKKQGFVTWQTIQLLLGPQEHVPFIQKSVEQFDVIDAETNEVFLKMLPSKCFPDKPDEAMEEWYEGVAARLKREAEAEADRTRVEDEPRTSADLSGDGSSANERTGAFKYFEDPMYRKARPRPAFMRHVSKEEARASNDHGPISRVRHMLNPFSRRRSLPPGRYDDDSFSDEDATPIASNPPSTQRYPTHKRPHPTRRESSLSTTDSDSDFERPPSRRRTPVLRHRRSHEPPVSPREYFPTYHEQYRPSPQHLPSERPDVRTSSAPSPAPVYGPTKSPLFATHVAQMQARNYYDRPTMSARASYRPVPAQNIRYASQSTSVSPQHADPPYARDHDRYAHRDRDASYEGGSSSNHGSSQSHRRHSSTGDAVYPRERHERDRDRDAARTRSHDRVKDEWDDRERDRSRDKRGYDRSREHSRDRDRDRDRHRGSHRYVTGVEGGVSGRRYPVVSTNPY
ncbi:hypothetical protein BU25DRAFT_480745 [Macroventuria anomochaeta]|uniref:Uncharacterized protein n=1 Tax=Macroventuria anomochaeta TaxID=301207 RepID=A0ACB6RNE4_9PLEO|nr:uncharacterized protein BU25DRAFT_480745 [Macroventuria anomochaeta]KAF2622434.1 hypothetical protein BU25DRAFT_480745 [Macroventuria anomochaeta]